jgi:glycosyltransferase involved in cell wall biosynthesis
VRLLLINQFFWPDTAPTGRFLLDVARAVEPGVEVTAICGASHYGTEDDTPKPDVRILRPSNARFSRTIPGRLLSYASFLAGAVFAGFRVGRPDTVLTLTTPPLTSVFGRILKLSRGCRHYIWEMDVYPDIAVDLGALKRNSMLACLIGALADWSRRNADGIIVLGEEMKARLLARDIPEHKIHVVENWADSAEISPQPFREGPLTVHYSGNFGLAHDFETIAAAIRHFANNPDFQFVFAGGGSRREQMQTLCQEIKIANVHFRDYSSRAELSTSLAEGHLGLVTQLSQTSGAIVPSKTYGIMAAGRPILYIGPRDTTPARLIAKHQCGWQIDPGDTSALITVLDRLSSERTLLSESGTRSRQAFEQSHDREMSTARIVKILGMNPIEVSVRKSAAPIPDRQKTAIAS